MDVFVTGGTGYLGQAIAPALLSRGRSKVAEFERVDLASVHATV